MKGFNGMNDQVGFGDAYKCFWVSLEGTYETILQTFRHRFVKQKSVIAGEKDEYIAGSFVAGNKFSCGIKMFYAVNISGSGDVFK